MNVNRNELSLKHNIPEETTGSYQRLDLFIKVLWLFCPNVTDSTAYWHYNSTSRRKNERNLCERKRSF
jgi:hypothetical protein